jgi:hypothetical protein
MKEVAETNASLTIAIELLQETEKRLKARV